MNEAGAGRTAGFASRFVAMTVDVLLIVVVEASAVGFALAVRSVFPSFVPLFLREHKVVVGAVLSAMLVVTYFVACWTAFGKTPGKALMGLKVVVGDGHRPHVGRAFVRFLGYIVSTIPIYLGFLWVLVSARRLGWHDHIASTRVVYVPTRRAVAEAEAEDAGVPKDTAMPAGPTG